MTEKTIDARGKACPQPVIETRRALSENARRPLRVIVDNAAATENVSRMARQMGCAVQVEEVATEETHVRITPSADAAPAPEERGSTARNVVLITSDEFGTGDTELGRILMRAFFKTLPEVPPRPEAILFINRGVRLTTEGSDLIDDIQALADSGVRICSCGTCLDYYHLMDKLKVGVVSNMYDVVSLLSSADRIIQP